MSVDGPVDSLKCQPSSLPYPSEDGREGRAQADLCVRGQLLLFVDMRRTKEILKSTIKLRKLHI